MRHTIDDAIALLAGTAPADVAAMREWQAVARELAADPSFGDDARALLVAAVQAAGRGAFEETERLLAAAAGAARVTQAPDEPAPLALDSGMVEEFVSEARELLESAESALLYLETNPEDDEAINTVFRAFHTIKGMAGFLGLDVVTKVAHKAESLLSRIRAHEIRCTGRHAELALRSVDGLKSLIEELAAPGDGGIDPDALLAALDRPDIEPSVPADPGDPTPAPGAGGAVEPHDRRLEASIRVRTDRLDQLIDMVGELVIAQAMIAEDELLRSTTFHELARKVTDANKIVRDLQDLSMGMRMVPLRGAFQKVTRLARDLARRSAKQLDVVIDGEDTEIDRTLVDVLSDPLVHMVRNAMDHGIESPAVRVAAGKPATGRLAIRAYHAGGNVVVEVADDGRGLDRERILRKAIAMGLVSDAGALSDREVYELIFAPGFSTAEAVTDISGRGVGMDVVRRNVEAMRGRIEIDSRPGRGTRFVIRLPLTLAITDGMVVRVGAERYIVPTLNIQVSFRPEPGMLSTIAGRGEMVTLRGDVRPVVRLHRLFGISDAEHDPHCGLLMVVGDGAQSVALLVDELLGQQQLVAKALGRGLGETPGVSGGAILGDGRVGLILDVHTLVALSRSPGAFGSRAASVA